MRKMYSKKQIEKMIEDTSLQTIDGKIDEYSEDNIASLEELVGSVNGKLTGNEAESGQPLVADGNGGVEFGEAGGGGTKLYSHLIELSRATQYPSDTIKIVIINSDNTPITSSNILSKLFKTDGSGGIQQNVILGQYSGTGYLLRFEIIPESDGIIGATLLKNTNNTLSIELANYKAVWGSDVVVEL